MMVYYIKFALFHDLTLFFTIVSLCDCFTLNRYSQHRRLLCCGGKIWDQKSKIFPFACQGLSFCPLSPSTPKIQSLI